MAQEVEQRLQELGLKLTTPPSSKDVLIELLKQGSACLSELDQSLPKSVSDAMQSLLHAIAKPELIDHQDQEVKLLVASCICEITRITAPEAPYDDEVLKDVFRLIVSTFSGLSDINGPSFGRRVVILETMAKYRSCVVMLDLECDDLIQEMFTTFFAVARDEHPAEVLASMQTIMEVVVEESEDVNEGLLLTLLSVLGRDNKDVDVASRNLATNVIKNCAAKLEPEIKQFLVSSISGDSKSLKPEISYNRLLYEVCCCAPEILSGIVPYLTGELLSDEGDIRLKAVALVGDLFALPESAAPEPFRPVFLEFLNRLTDRTVEVRMSVLEYVRKCLMENPSRAETHEITSALCDRLLDHDENVRKQAVSVVCDVACNSLTSVPMETMKLVSERLRDKSLMVKNYTMERLADVYRASFMNKSGEPVKNDGYDWIIGKILRCFYDKDFRSDAVEPILSISMFPNDFSVKDKVKSWVRIFSGFDKVEAKALEKIIEQKQRLQLEMQKYLSLRQASQEGDGADIQKKVTFGFRVMSHYFMDPAKAEECLQHLDQLKDSKICEILTQFLDPDTISDQARNSREVLLKILGEQHPLYDFLGTLSLKCSYIVFDKDHVKELLVEAAALKSSGSTELILSCMTILVILARFCPLLFGGLEEKLVHLLEDDNEIIKEGGLHILAKAGETIREQLGVTSRSLDLILERICIEGSRRQAKYSVHALASITKDDGLMSLSVLYKRLVDLLEEKLHLPAVLQSLGCIAEAAMSVFETRESEVEKFVKENILAQGHIEGDKASDCWDDLSEAGSLKIFGIKALVKSYLPVKDAQLRSGIDDLIRMLKNILIFGDISEEIESSSVDKAHLKLAAAKSILRLSKQWEHKIPVDVLYLTLRTSEENFPEVKKLLLDKVHQYVKDRILDPKYACAFVLDISSSKSESDENKQHLSDIIQMCRQGKGRQISPQNEIVSQPLYPEYMLPYVVHSLAHHPLFPNLDECKDVEAYETIYRRLYLFLSMLLHGDADEKSDISISQDKEILPLLTCIFLCIKLSEDVFDAAESKNSYALCDLGLSMIKRLSSNQENVPDSSASIPLPPELYRPLDKKVGSDSVVDVEKTWLADENILPHFDSLDLESNKLANKVTSEDDFMKDTETEGSEMPLAKLMKRLKAKARKESKNEPAQAGATTGNVVDILKMVKEINSDAVGATNNFESSNGHGYSQKKKADDEHDSLKRKSLLSESMDIPVPKRKRSSSAQAQKSSRATSLKKSKRPTAVNQENMDINKEDEKFRNSSEDQSAMEKGEENAELELLVSRIRKSSSSFKSKKKAKSFEDDQIEGANLSPDSQTPKKMSETTKAPTVSNSKSGSSKKQTPKSGSGLTKCTTMEQGSSMEDLIGKRIKVWWPIDKKYYEGVVKSYDSEKKKHVILYNDGEVEVLCMDKERWEFVDSGPKTKQSGGSTKGSHSKVGSSGQKRKLTEESLMQDKQLKEKSSASQAKKKTPKGSTKLKQKITPKAESSKKMGGSTGKKQKSKKVIADEDMSESEKEEGVEENLKNAEHHKEEDMDSEDTHSDNHGGLKPERHESGDAATFSSANEQKKEADEDSEETPASKPDKKTSDAAEPELSDDAPLTSWKRKGRKQTRV